MKQPCKKLININLKCGFGISRISFVQWQFSGINLSDRSFKEMVVNIQKRSSKYLEVVLKVSLCIIRKRRYKNSK